MTSRLRHAIETGALSLPETGALGFLNAPAMLDPCDMEPDRIHASQSLFPAHAALCQRGFASVTPEPVGDYAAAHLSCHRDGARTLALLREALMRTTPGGLVMIEGAKTDGVARVQGALTQRFAQVDSLSKAHGKLLWLTRPETLPDLSDWQAQEVTLPGGFITVPGVFSAEKIDKGSALLAKHLPQFKGSGVDLGGGWGYLSTHVLESPDVTALDVVEAEQLALNCAARNLCDPRISLHWADATKWTGSYEFAVTNPPFHQSRKADPALGQSFIQTAAKLLKPSGQLWLVANRNLPYEQVLSACFQEVSAIAETDGFKVIRARRPKSARTSR